jgi:dynein heavy chain
MYQTLSPTLRTLKDSLDIAIDSKEENIVKFTLDLEKMTTELFSEVSEIRNSAQDPMVLSADSNSSEVIAYLEDLQQQLQKVENLKVKYEGWMDLFRRGGEPAVVKEEEERPQTEPEPTESSDLDETRKEIDMKHLLWTSLKEWHEITT